MGTKGRPIKGDSPKVANNIRMIAQVRIRVSLGPERLGGMVGGDFVEHPTFTRVDIESGKRRSQHFLSKTYDIIHVP